MLSGFFEGVDELIGSWNLNVQDQVFSTKNDMAFTYVLCEVLHAHSCFFFVFLIFVPLLDIAQ